MGMSAQSECFVAGSQASSSLERGAQAGDGAGEFCAGVFGQGCRAAARCCDQPCVCLAPASPGCIKGWRAFWLRPGQNWPGDEGCGLLPSGASFGGGCRNDSITWGRATFCARQLRQFSHRAGGAGRLCAGYVIASIHKPRNVLRQELQAAARENGVEAPQGVQVKRRYPGPCV